MLTILLTVGDEDLPAGRQVSYSNPEIRLAIFMIHNLKVRKGMDASQINVAGN
jgi:hypothetical protein